MDEKDEIIKKQEIDFVNLKDYLELDEKKTKSTNSNPFEKFIYKKEKKEEKKDEKKNEKKELKKIEVEEVITINVGGIEIKIPKKY
jgi:hypothetical protein